MIGTVNNESPNNVSEAQIHPVYRKKTITSVNNNKTIFDIVSQITVLVCLVGLGIVVGIADSVEPSNFNLEEYHWLPFSLLLYGPVIGWISVFTIMFTRNAAMREGIWRTIKHTFKRNQE